MVTFLTSGICPRCGCQLHTSDLASYGFVCHRCEENFYTIEVKKNNADFFEINVKLSAEEFEKKEAELSKIAEKYNCDFFGYDEFCAFNDYGWEKGFPDSEIINSFVNDIKSVINSEVYAVGQIINIGYYGGFKHKSLIKSQAEVIDISGDIITIKIQLSNGGSKKMFGYESQLRELEQNFHK